MDLYIHIGAPKTGTTLLQHYLRRNQESLACQGLLYPSGGRDKSAHKLIGAAVFPGRSDRLGGVSPRKALQTAVQSIRKEIDEQKPHTVVLSTEFLWGELPVSDVQRLLQPFDDCSIKIVAYLRRQDLFAQSLYGQVVKGGLAEPFPTWLERAVDSGKGGFNYHDVLSCWKNSVPNVDVIARVYEKSQLQADIRLDFLNTVCPQIEPPPLSTEQDTDSSSDPASNSSPDRATIELLRLVSEKVAGKLAARRRTEILRQIVRHSPKALPFAPKNYMSPDEAASLVGRFAEQNAMVARDFLGRPDGTLFQEPLPAGDSDLKEDYKPEVLLERLTSLLPVIITGKSFPTARKERAITARKGPVGVGAGNNAALKQPARPAAAKRAERHRNRQQAAGRRGDLASL